MLLRKLCRLTHRVPQMSASMASKRVRASYTVTTSPRLSLITPVELQAELRSLQPPLLLDASFHGIVPEACIEGSVLIDIASEIEVCNEDARGHPHIVSGNYSLKPAEELRAALEAAGVQSDRRTVVYTQSVRAGASDLAPATRLAWCLAVAGVKDIVLLPGGLRAWTAAGLATASAHTPRQSADFFGGDASLPFPLNPHLSATTEEVEAAVAERGARGVQLADVRSWPEYIGQSNNYPYPVPCGRIPTARWAHWGKSTYVGDELVTPDGDFAPLAGTSKLWTNEGLTLGYSRIVCYCGSGWRASLTWYGRAPSKWPPPLMNSH